MIDLRQDLVSARLSAHSRYRALNRRRVLKRRRVLNRWRVLRLLGSSLSIHCTSLHNRIVSPARRYLRTCRLAAEWEHAVPTSRCRRPGHLKRTILPSTSLETVKEHDIVNKTQKVSLSKLLPGAAAQNHVFLFEIQWVCRRAEPSMFDGNTLGLVWRRWTCTIDRQQVEQFRRTMDGVTTNTR